MDDTQLAAYLLTSAIAAASMLLSVFGSLYGVYARYMTVMENGVRSPICKTIHKLSWLLCLIIVILTTVAFYSFFIIFGQEGMTLPEWLRVLLGFAIILIPIPALVITWKMH